VRPRSGAVRASDKSEGYSGIENIEVSRNSDINRDSANLVLQLDSKDSGVDPGAEVKHTMSASDGGTIVPNNYRTTGTYQSHSLCRVYSEKCIREEQP
jgi:hypothetical protein